MELAKKKRKGSPTRRMDHITAYLMILPAFALLATFVIYPLYMALTKSFTNWSFYGVSEFIGFKNFKEILFSTPLFTQSLVNVLKFVVIIVPCQMLLAFLFAHVAKNLSGGLATVVKISIYVPGVIAGVVAGVIFVFILDYRAGILNELLKTFGLPRIAYTSKEFSAVLAIIIPTLWMGFGYSTLVMYAGLLNIPKEYYEAAMVDGATPLVQLFKITIPSLKNIFVLLSIGMVTGTLQMFDIPFILTGGGPINKTLTPMFYLYNNFKDMGKNMGLTLAGAILMMIIIGLINSVVFNVITSEKSQDA